MNADTRIRRVTPKSQHTGASWKDGARAAREAFDKKPVETLRITFSAKDVKSRVFNLRVKEIPSETKQTCEQAHDNITKKLKDAVRTISEALDVQIRLDVTEYVNGNDSYAGEQKKQEAFDQIMTERMAGYYAAMGKISNSVDGGYMAVFDKVSQLINSEDFESKRVGIAFAGGLLYPGHITHLVGIGVDQTRRGQDGAVLKESLRALGKYKRLKGIDSVKTIVSFAIKPALKSEDPDTRATALNTARKVLNSQRIKLIESEIAQTSELKDDVSDNDRKGTLRDMDRGCRIKVAAALSTSSNHEVAEAIRDMILRAKGPFFPTVGLLAIDMIGERSGNSTFKLLMEIQEKMGKEALVGNDPGKPVDEKYTAMFRKILGAAIERQSSLEKGTRVLDSNEKEENLETVESLLKAVQNLYFSLRKKLTRGITCEVDPEDKEITADKLLGDIRYRERFDKFASLF